jgi:nucleoside-diphosphate-sugar epimerase
LFLPIQIVTFLSSREYEGKFFTFGSYFEIGNNANFVSFDEDAVSNSKEKLPNNYCVSKRLLSSFYKDALAPIKFYHFILPTIYGKGESEHRLIPYLLKSVETGMPISVTSGNQVRQYLHIKDFVTLFGEILCSPNVPYGIYNFPSQTTISVKEIVSHVCLMYGISSNIVHTSDNRYDETMLYLALQSSKIQNLFPYWKPEYSLEKGILDYGLPLNFKTNP